MATDLPISGLSSFVPPISPTDLFVMVQNLSSTPVTRKIAYSSMLTQLLSDIGKTNLSTGFSIAGGTASRTLTVIANSTIDQNLQSTAGVSFSSVLANSFILKASTSGNLGTLSVAPTLGQATAFILADPAVSSTGFIYSTSAIDQSITSTAAAPGLSIVGAFAIGLYGQYECKDILNTNYHFTCGVSSVSNAAMLWAGNAGVGFIPMLLQSEGGSYVGIGSSGNGSWINFNPISTPSTPSVSANLYSKTVSGTTGLYAQDSTGTEFLLTQSQTNYWQLNSGILSPLTAGNTLKIVADEANSQPQIQIAGQTDPLKQFNVYLNTTNNVAVLEGRRSGTPYPIYMQPNLGLVAIGYGETVTGLTSLLNVNGSVFFENGLTIASGNFITTNGNHVAGSAGNGSSFQSYNNDGSILFFFSSANASVYNNVVTNASTGQNSLWQFPDPSTTAPTNVLISNSAGTQTVSTGNLALTAGYFNFSAISLPSTPTASANIYARTVSGTTDLYALNSAGTEVNLTGASAGYWSPITYNALPLLQPTSNSQVGVYFSSSGVEGAIYNDGGNYMRHYFNGTEVLAYNGSQFDVLQQANFFANITGFTVGSTISYPIISSQGITGATAASRYVGATASTQPTSGTFAQGDFLINQTYGTIYTCVTGGTFGSWAMVGTPLLAAGSTSGLAPLTSVQVTINTGSPYMASILGLTVDVVEGTTNLPLTAKIVSYVVGPPSTITVEIYNLSATLTTGTIQIKVFSTGF